MYIHTRYQNRIHQEINPLGAPFSREGMSSLSRVLEVQRSPRMVSLLQNPLISKTNIKILEQSLYKMLPTTLTKKLEMAPQQPQCSLGRLPRMVLKKWLKEETLKKSEEVKL